MKKLVEFFRKFRNKRANRKLLAKYPILMPHYFDFVDKEERYDYSYTMLDMVCVGWKDIFLETCDQIQKHLTEKGFPLNGFWFEEIKEKWGSLRIYAEGGDAETDNMIEELETRSMLFCPSCGKPSKYVTSGYVLYLCPECYGKSKLKGTLLTEKDIPYWKEYKHEEDGTVTTTIKRSAYDADFKKQWNGQE